MIYATVLFKLSNGRYSAFTIGTLTGLYTESYAQSAAIGGFGREFVWSKVIMSGAVVFQTGDTSVL